MAMDLQTTLYYRIHMSSPENIRSNELEVVMLRSDLTELFQTHADKIITKQSDDWERPTEIMLSGIFQFTHNGILNDIDVHVRQRLDQHGVDYLMISGQPNNYYWCQITDTDAMSVATQKPMDDLDIACMRRMLSPGATKWSEDNSRIWKYLSSPYDTAENYRQRLA
jgi:hypothetical protein